MQHRLRFHIKDVCAKFEINGKLGVMCGKALLFHTLSACKLEVYMNESRDSRLAEAV